MPKSHSADPRGEGELGPRSVDRVGRWQRVGHVENGRHTAHDRGATARQPRLLVLETGFAEMDVAVDNARKDEQPCASMTSGGWIVDPGAHRGHLAITDADIERRAVPRS